MVEHIYNLEEFIKKTGIEQTVLDKLIEAQVIMPAGQVDGNTPYFDQNGLDAADTITKLLDIGYSSQGGYSQQGRQASCLRHAVADRG